MDTVIFHERLQSLIRSIHLSIVHVMQQNFQPLGISPSQATILISLYKSGPLMVSELSRMTKMPPSNISSICSRLEKSGLIRRERDDEDQRVVRVQLTDHAKRLTEEAEKRLKAKQQEFSASVPEADKELILNALILLEKSLDSRERVKEDGKETSA